MPATVRHRQLEMLKDIVCKKRLNVVQKERFREMINLY